MFRSTITNLSTSKTTNNQQTTNQFITEQEVKIKTQTFALNLQTTNTKLKKQFKSKVPKPPPRQIC